MSHPIDHITRHVDLPEEHRTLLRELMVERQFKRGDTIDVSQDLMSHSYFIRKGSARAFYIRKGLERTYSFAFDDEFIITPVSLMKIPDTTLSIEFLEPTEVVVMPNPNVKAIMAQQDKAYSLEVATHILKLLFEHTRMLEERLLMFQLMNAVERYEWFISTYPTITERATLTEIASFLGIAKETLYRIRSGKYKNNG